ncbi:MAG: hypothetical protein F6K41_22155 [Symploca sp. SIO3E6]|nr:hypothetical protein [Caldora sp. SIO3E6]
MSAKLTPSSPQTLNIEEEWTPPPPERNSTAKVINTKTLMMVTIRFMMDVQKIV